MPEGITLFDVADGLNKMSTEVKGRLGNLLETIRGPGPQNINQKSGPAVGVIPQFNQVAENLQAVQGQISDLEHWLGSNKANQPQAARGY